MSGLPPDRFGSGSAVTQSVRNLGATLGMALTVAFTADVAGGRALDDAVNPDAPPEHVGLTCRDLVGAPYSTRAPD